LARVGKAHGWSHARHCMCILQVGLLWQIQNRFQAMHGGKLEKGDGRGRGARKSICKYDSIMTVIVINYNLANPNPVFVFVFMFVLVLCSCLCVCFLFVFVSIFLTLYLCCGCVCLCLLHLGLG
jgi:hypothetical protein